MESIVFEKGGSSTKMTILDLCREQSLAVYLKFTENAHVYFKREYLDEYQYFLLNTDNKFCFASRIDRIWRPQSTFQVTLLEHHRSDAERYDDSCYLIKTTPSNLNGYVLKIPITIVCGVSIDTTKIQKR